MDNDKRIGIRYKHKEKESSEAITIKEMFRNMKVKELEIKNAKRAIELHQSLQTSDPEPPESLLENFSVHTATIEGRKVFTISPKQNTTKKQLLFLHGGGYMQSILDLHWPYIEKLVSQFNCTIIVPDYPLSPIHTYIGNFKFIEPLYTKLITENNPQDVIIIGDSAGGGFALALAQRAQELDLPQPSHIILMSPYLDCNPANRDVSEIEKIDPIGCAQIFKLAGEAYTKGGDIDNYMASPINGMLEGLGKISLFVSTHECLYTDAERLKELCDRKGVAIDYYVYPKMPHVFIAFDVPEAKVAFEQMRHCFV